MSPLWMSVYTYACFIIQTYVTYWFIISFLKPRTKYFITGATIFTIVVLILRQVLMVMNQNFPNVVYFITAFWVYVTMCAIAGKWESFKKNIGCAVLVYVAMVSASGIATWFCGNIVGANVIAQQNRSDYNMAYVLITPIVTLFMIMTYQIVVCIARIRQGKSKHFTTRMLIALTLYEVIQITILVYNAKTPTSVSIALALGLSLLSMIVDLIFPILLDEMERSEAKREEQMILTEISRQESKHYIRMRQKMEEARTKRHDYVNLLNVAENMLRLSQDEEETMRDKR